MTGPRVQRSRMKATVGAMRGMSLRERRPTAPRAGSRTSAPYGEPDDKVQSNFTDPDSAIMKTSAEGFRIESGPSVRSRS